MSPRIGYDATTVGLRCYFLASGMDFVEPCRRTVMYVLKREIIIILEVIIPALSCKMMSYLLGIVLI